MILVPLWFLCGSTRESDLQIARFLRIFRLQARAAAPAAAALSVGAIFRLRRNRANRAADYLQTKYPRPRVDVYVENPLCGVILNVYALILDSVGVCGFSCACAR